MEENNLQEGQLWYKDAIIYEVHIKSFYDSNGDGYGDLEGFLQKLDYLEELGVTAIWLLPFYPSPLRDDGYDIADYYNINPDYGDLNTFKKLIEEAHRRGLKIITELVINHTSDQHPWFKRARKALPDSPERNFYVWSDDPHKYPDVRIIFTDMESSNWTWDQEAQAYYWHRFFYHQPDLNFDNPLVQDEVFKILDHWLGLGVDGFRLDAVPYLFERKGTNCENLPETHAFLKKLRRYVDDHYENKLLLAEANMWPEDAVAYFGDGDECHMNYHFPIMPRMFMALKMENRYPVTDIIDQTPGIPQNCQWALFLRNHDELTLEMVTDEERDYMYRVYARDARARINVGIRHRLAPLLENNRSKIELMNILLFSLPGTPVLYYGDEIGMGDNYYLGDRDGVRTPMQWDGNKNAGFSTAPPEKLYLPVIIDPEYRYETINVENQKKNPSSLLWWVRRLIAMRKKHMAFGRGDIRFFFPANARVIAFTRTYDEDTLLILVNLSRFPQAVELDLTEYKGQIPVELFGQNKFPVIGEEPYRFTMGGYGYFWFSIQPVVKPSSEETSLPKLKLKSLESITQGTTVREMESAVLPGYLKRCRWFGGKGQVIQSIGFGAVLPVTFNRHNYLIATVNVSYNEGLPEEYLLPLGFLPSSDEEASTVPPKGIITRTELDGQNGWLVDSVYLTDFREGIFDLIRKSVEVDHHKWSLNGNTTGNSLGDGKDVESRVLNVEQSNTSIIYNNRHFLKFYRKLDTTINPDVEISRFLTEKAHFAHVPEFEGSVSLQSKTGEERVLGMVQQLVDHQGDAYSHAKDMLKIFFEQAMSHPERADRWLAVKPLTTTLSESDLSEDVYDLVGLQIPHLICLLGQRTAEMHKALVARDHPDFAPEPFSLHYQRSLYSGLRSLTRSAMENLQQNISSLPEELRGPAEAVLAERPAILEAFKKIFVKKIDAMKIRNHGDYHLGQVLWTGKDFMIIDFEGEPARSFSERRLKRSPLRDVAGMIRSFHYAEYDVIKNHHDDGQQEEAREWGERWYNLTGRIYLQSYRSHMKNSGLLPSGGKDFRILLDIYLLEKAVYELNYEINNRPDWVDIPLKGMEEMI